MLHLFMIRVFVGRTPPYLLLLHAFACFGPSGRIIVHGFLFRYWYFLSNGFWTIASRNSSGAAELVLGIQNGAAMVVFSGSSQEFDGCSQGRFMNPTGTIKGLV